MTTVLTKCGDIPGIKSVSSHEAMTYFVNDLRDHEYHRPQIHWLTWNKQMPLSPFREKTRKWGKKWYLKTKAEEKSQAEVSFGEY